MGAGGVRWLVPIPWPWPAFTWKKRVTGKPIWNSPVPSSMPPKKTPAWKSSLAAGHGRGTGRRNCEWRGNIVAGIGGALEHDQMTPTLLRAHVREGRYD